MSAAPPRPLGPHAGWLVVAAAAIAWHAAAGAHVFDAGELVQAGFQLGGSHPPGQPLHALLAKAATLVPLGPVPWRMAWVSAAGAVAAAWLAGRITGLLLEQLDVRRGALARLAPDATALAVLLSGPVLRQAARVEVYGIALSLTLLSLYALLRWAGPEGPERGRALRVAALAAGLAAAVHPPHALAAVAVGLGLLLARRRDVLRSPRALGWAALGFVAAVLFSYSFLPGRAAAGAPMWGDPSTPGGLWDYVTARAYQQNLGSVDGSITTHLGSGLRYVAVASGLVPLAGVALLAARAHRSDPARAAIVAAAVSVLAAWVIPIDEAIPDAVAYAGAPVALAIAAGAAGLAFAAARAETAAARWGAGLAIAALALNPPALFSVRRVVSQDAPALETLAGALADTPPPRALVVVRGDFEGAAWMMAQGVDGARPDVAVFVPGLATSSWHWRSLTHHPLYDGRPIRGRGRDTRSAYVDGALSHAAGSVPLALGPMLLHGTGSLAGPYRIVWARAAADPGPVWRGAVGERLMSTVARDAAAGPEGDAGTLGAVIRHHQVSHAERLYVRGGTRAALADVRRAMRGLPHEERVLLSDAPVTARRPLPPIVQSPTSFLTTPDEALRAGAAMLFAAGAEDRATELLARQLERGDPAAALQLGWLRLSAGDREGAREAARAVLAEAPALAEEARRLDAAARAEVAP